jgi:hydrogenase nickel incorporation protein HypB
MCATCGCTDDLGLMREHDGAAPHEHDGAAPHEHDGAAPHEHAPAGDDHSPGAALGDRTVVLEQKVLARNDELAAANRAWLASRGVFAVNLMSSPGSGKTTLLQRTAVTLSGSVSIGVIEGDQETALDAERVRAAGCRAVQVNTGAGCHLDAAMVARALRDLQPGNGSAVVIENVGNLVCPALFDLGETARVVLASVAEGADKPVKYPQMFRHANLVLVTKRDLLPYVDFDVTRFRADLKAVSPGAALMELSAVTGAGLRDWLDWLQRQARRARQQRRPDPG